MIALEIIMNGDSCWPDLVLFEEGERLAIAVLSGGTTEGHPSVTIRIDLPSDRIVLAQTTARLFCTAAKMIEAKYPDLFKD